MKKRVKEYVENFFSALIVGAGVMTGMLIVSVISKLL